MTMATIMPILKLWWMVVPMVFFIGVVLWAYWPSKRALFEAQGRIPLKGDDGEER